MTIQMKPTEQFFMILFIILQLVVLNFKHVGETFVCYNSNENCWVARTYMYDTV